MELTKHINPTVVVTEDDKDCEYFFVTDVEWNMGKGKQEAMFKVYEIIKKMNENSNFWFSANITRVQSLNTIMMGSQNCFVIYGQPSKQFDKWASVRSELIAEGWTPPKENV